MNGNWRRGTTCLVFRRALHLGGVPTALAAVLGVVGNLWFPAPESTLPGGAGAATAWLHLPLGTAAACAAIAALRLWPAFAMRQPGRDVVVRQSGRLQGCGAALAGACLAQAALALPVLLLLPAALGAPAAARAQLAARVPTAPVLDRDNPRLAAQVPDLPIEAIVLRPLAALPDGPLVGSQVAVDVDGVRIDVPPVEFRQTQQPVRLPLRAGPVRTLELHLVAGNVPLFFPPGTIEVVGAEPHPRAWNALALLPIAVLPVALALALACLCGAAAAMATQTALVATVLFTTTVGGVGPFDDAVLDLLRGRWLPASGVFQAGLPSLGVGVLAMILAMLVRRRCRS